MQGCVRPAAKLCNENLELSTLTGPELDSAPNIQQAPPGRWPKPILKASCFEGDCLAVKV